MKTEVTFGVADKQRDIWAPQSAPALHAWASAGNPGLVYMGLWDNRLAHYTHAEIRELAIRLLELADDAETFAQQQNNGA